MNASKIITNSEEREANMGKKDTALAKAPEAQPLVIDTAAILAAANNPEVDAEKCERLFALAERCADRASEQQFSEAMNRVQAAMGPVRKTAKNDHTGSHYARLEDIDKMLNPLYVAEGFSISAGTEDSPIDKHLRVVLDVRHSGGHSKRYHLDALIDNVGIKGSPTKTALHGMGSTLSYCTRYLKCLVFNVRLIGHDDDGNSGNAGPGMNPITETQADEINKLISDTQAKRDVFLAYFDVKEVADLQLKQYREAKRALEAKK